MPRALFPSLRIRSTVKARGIFPSIDWMQWFFQESFLKERIKVGGKTGQLGNSITLELAKTKLSIVSEIPLSKR